MSLFAELKRRNVLRVVTAYLAAAWLVFQVAETVFPVIGLGEGALRIVLAVLAIGLLPAAIGAWVFEWTPDGLKRDRDVAEGDTSERAQRRLDRLIMVVLTLAVGTFAFDKFILDPARDQAREAEVAEQARTEAMTGFYGDRSIAVLPFVNLSSDPEQVYFAEGISEEVLNLLARIRGLRVISRSSAFAFKDKDLEIPEIAERLDVAHILEGSVRKYGDQVRVTAQLIEARSDTHLWSETFDHTFEDVFALQDEIAARVAEQLQLEIMGPMPRSPVTDPEVRALTIQARQLYESRPSDAGRKMYGLLEQALAMDPDYLPALEWMTVAIFFRHQAEDWTPDRKERQANLIRDRIRAIDPDNNSLLSDAAWNAAYVEGDLEQGARLYEQLMARDATDSGIVRMAAIFAYHIGDFHQAIRLARHSVAIDPLCYTCLYTLSRAQLYAGQYQQAEETRARLLSLSQMGGHYHYALMKILQGRAAEALELVATESAWTAPHQKTTIRIMALHELGRREEALATYHELVAAEGGEQLITMRAGAAAWLGLTDQAFDWLHGIPDRNSYEVRNTAFHHEFEPLHGDPRWAEWRESIGMSPERLAAIGFNPPLPE